MYETLVAETDARFSEAEVVFKERQQQQHVFSRCRVALHAASQRELSRWQVTSSRQEAAGVDGHVLHTTGSLIASARARHLCDSAAGAAACVYGRFAAPGQHQIKFYKRLFMRIAYWVHWAGPQRAAHHDVVAAAAAGAGDGACCG